MRRGVSRREPHAFLLTRDVERQRPRQGVGVVSLILAVGARHWLVDMLPRLALTTLRPIRVDELARHLDVSDADHLPSPAGTGSLSSYSMALARTLMAHWCPFTAVQSPSARRISVSLSCSASRTN